MKSKKYQKPLQQKPEDFPMVVDPMHVYNLLIEEGIGGVDLGSHYYTFELHSNLKECDEKVDGVTTFSPEKTIKLEMSLSDADAKETIFHEILHTILHSAGLEEYNFDGEMISTTNEALVTIMSKAFRQLHILNPGLMQLIFNTHE